jgi:hypothetical protein
LRLAGGEVLIQMLDGHMSHIGGVPERTHDYDRQYQQNPFARIRLRFHLDMFAFVSHTFFLL